MSKFGRWKPVATYGGGTILGRLWRTYLISHPPPSVFGVAMKSLIDSARCCALCFICMLGGTLWAEQEPNSSKPNIVLIMADDFGYECVSANGGQSYKTPNLDRLAASGVRFEHCHVQPLCTPTRVQLMTGRYNIRNYLNFGTLPRGEVTFGQLLKQSGYATGICGKWQLGKEVDSPKHFGFDESLLWQHTRRPARYANPGLEYNGKEIEYPLGSYGPTIINDFAIDFASRHKNHPFFLYYPMILTHSPYQPTPDSDRWDPATQGEKQKDQPSNFADMVEYMDKMVGRLDAKLSELGIRDNTLLIFIGDNGTGRTITSRFRGAELKGGKGTTTHLGTHVPLIVSWPGVVKNGRVLDDLVSSVDVLPTLCDAAHVKVQHAIDGLSILPALLGKPATTRESLYCWYSPRQKMDLSAKEFAFNREFKLYRTGELYRIDKDTLEVNPLEISNLDRDALAAKQMLQRTLDQYTNARPQELDRQFVESMKKAKTE
jgi:arylsulfatase A